MEVVQQRIIVLREMIKRTILIQVRSIIALALRSSLKSFFHSYRLFLSSLQECDLVTRQFIISDFRNHMSNFVRDIANGRGSYDRGITDLWSEFQHGGVRLLHLLRSLRRGLTSRVI